ncbi:helix-turn-helix domain-containing protein [Halalkalibaculum sp. DA3122]|uniref:helix-turn-helix domain-containing protein n=1 Tax=Halalkalibaculum sp. DA3122 TaxID=3373607 RepID=UPI00375500AC
MILKEELGKASLRYSISPHGAVEFLEETTQTQLEELNRNLLQSGLELLDQSNSMLIDRIINTVIEVIHYSDELPNLSFEDIIGKSLGSERESLLKIFSDVKGISIMQFILLQKIERVKELLLYEDLSLAEISQKLRYKNEHYLIAQFKKFTGLHPTYFQKLKRKRTSISHQI